MSDQITTAEAARILKCSRATIVNMIKRGTIHAQKLDPKAKSVYRLERAEIETLVKSQQHSK